MVNGLHDGWLWGMHMGGWLVWLLLIGGVVWAISRSQQHTRVRASAQSDTPLEALQRRYANGEISTDEYEERKKRL